MSSKAASLLLAVLGGALVLVTAPQTWVSVTLGGSSGLSYELAGSAVAPAIVALGGAAIAAVAVVALVPFVGRLVFAALGLLAAGAAIGATFAALGTLPANLAEMALKSAGLNIAGFDPTGSVASWTWIPWLAVLGATLAAAGFVIALLTARRWSRAGARYERVSTEPLTSAGQWDALSDGDDPTAAS